MPVKKETPRQIAYSKIYRRYGPLVLFLGALVVVYTLLIIILDSSGIKIIYTLYDTVVWTILSIFALIIAIMYGIEILKASKIKKIKEK